jgi:8-oxo-dGTP diphosphatase
VQTLIPLASLVDEPIVVHSTFDEDADPVAAAVRLRELAAAGPSTVVCSQGGLIPPMLAAIAQGGREFPTPKATAWVVSFADTWVAAVDRLTADV